jgi:Ca2+-binding EF-hand superfamily protein
MKTILLGAAAVATVAGLAPALAQTAATAGHHRMKPVARAEVSQKVQQHFVRLDADRDGFVTRAEVDAGRDSMRARKEERAEKRGDARFDRIDANNDSAISREEFEAARAQRQQRAGGRGARSAGKRHFAGLGGHMFEMADLNRDGRVSPQEANQAALQHFDRLDANRDGMLTRDEMRAARASMRGATGS